MKHINIIDENTFAEKSPKRLLIHESPYMKVLNFNFQAGQELPIHSHDIEGEVNLFILEGEGEFLGPDGAVVAAKTGDCYICDIAEPHGIRAKTDLRVLVNIAPPI